MFRRYYGVTKKFFGMGVVSKRLFSIMIIFNVLREALELVFPFIAAEIINLVSIGNFTGATSLATLFLVYGILFTFVCHLASNSYTKFSIDLREKLRNKYVEKVSKYDEAYTDEIPHAFITSSAFGDIASTAIFGEYIILASINLLSIVAACVILMFVDLPVGLAAVVLVTIATISLGRNLKRRDFFSSSRSTTQDSIANVMGQIIEGNKEIQAFNIQDKIRDHAARFHRQWDYETRSMAFYSANSFALTPTILHIGRIAIYVALTILVISQGFPVATLVLIVGYYANIIDGFQEFAVDHVPDLSTNSVAVDRVHRVLNYRSKHMHKFGDYDRDSIDGKVEFRNVSFSYDQKRRILKNIDFIIPPHSLVAIVGRSGSGKTSIFRLLARLFKPSSGKILLDDVDINEYTSEVYVSNVASVSQSPFVFNMSIRENLSLVNPNHEEQVAACKKAGVHDFIINLRNGYDTQLNGDSKVIPESKKQLIAIARALLSKAEVILLDEVTAATDMNTSEKIIKIMQELKEDHTVIIATHDPGIMRKADRIIIIDDGEVVGQGTHKTLLSRNKYYRRIQNR